MLRVVPALLLLFLAAPASAAPPLVDLPPPDERLVIEGQKILLEDVYRAIARLPADAPINEATAETIRARVLAFLRKSGYVLARVDAEIKDQKLHLEIDEGQLDKVIFPGLGGLSTLRMALALDMPGNIFNRPHLVRRLALLSDKHDFKSVRWALVRTATIADPGPQLADVAELEGTPLVPETGIYELHIIIDEKEWSTGLSPSIAFESPDGLMIGARYRWAPVFFEGERWVATLQGGMRVQQIVSRGTGERFFSRASLHLSYATPELRGSGARVMLAFSSHLISRQRIDLGIRTYDFLQVDPSMRLVIDRLDWLELTAGVGLEYRNIFGLDEVEPVRPRVDPVRALRPFYLASAEVIFDPDNLREDRHHRVRLEGRHYARAGSLGRATLEYEKTWMFDWDELRLVAGGTFLWGTVPFTDEASVGDHLRAVFGSDLFTKKAAAASIEYRLSLSRDYFKIGFFHDLVGFAGIDRSTGAESPRLANSAGLGLHFLIADAYQLSLYGAAGFTLNRVEGGFSLSLSQAF